MNVRWVAFAAAAVAASIALTGCATLAGGTATPNQVAAARAALGTTLLTTAVPTTAVRTAQPKPTAAKPSVVKTVTSTVPPPVVVTITRTTAAPYPVPVPVPVPDGTASYLRSEVYADSFTAESVTGLWIPQVSSKSQGSQDSEMLADFTELSSRFPDTILVTSGDFSSFTHGGYWVALVARAFPSGEAANAWCDLQQFGADDCFAKRLSHSEGPEGNSQQR